MRVENVRHVLGKWFLSVALMSAILFSSGCRNDLEGDYLRLAGKLFIFNYRIASVTYVVTLQRLRPLPEGSRFIATFENPSNGSPLLVARKIWPGDGPIAIESDPVSCIKKGVPYAFKVEIFFRDKSIQVIEGAMTSTLDQSVLPDRPLVIGPGYEPSLANDENTDAFLKLEKSRACRK